MGLIRANPHSTVQIDRGPAPEDCRHAFLEGKVRKYGGGTEERSGIGGPNFQTKCFSDH